MKKVFFIGILLVFFSLASPVFAEDNFGFNIHSLSRESKEFIGCTLDWLSKNCNTNIIRLWGYQGTLGVNGINDLQKVLDTAPANMKFIVALEDFPYGPAIDNPQEWFSSGYKNNYRNYVQQIVSKYKNNPKIVVWEIMNEPHCKGNSNCLPALYGFIKDIASLIRSIDSSTYISAGMMGGEIPWGEYQNINKIPGINAASCHYNADTNNVETCLEAIKNKGNATFFYVGEAGYMGNNHCSGGGCTNTNCTNCCDTTTLQQRASKINQDRNALLGKGANAFLVWQFSPPGNSLLICDKFSVFPQDPICSGEEPFTCSPLSSSSFSPYYLRDSLASNDLTLNYHKKETDEKYITPTPSLSPSSSVLGNQDKVETGEKKFEGSIKINTKNLPNFSKMEGISSSALTKLLPENLRKELFIDTSQEVKGKTKHFVYGLDENKNKITKEGKDERKVPEEKATFPSWWGQLIGESKVLCGLFNTCSAPDNLKIKIIAAENDPLEGTKSQNSSSNVAEKNISNNAPDPSFSTNSFFTKIWKTIEEVWKGLIKIITTGETTTDLQAETRAVVPGGADIKENTSFFKNFLPASAIPANRNSPLKVNADYEVSSEYAPEGEEKLEYHDLGASRRNYCLSLCSQYPAGFNISQVDPLCSSCRPDDYPLEGL